MLLWRPVVIQKKNCKFVDFSLIFGTVSSTWKWTFARGDTLELLCTLLDIINYGAKHFTCDIKTVVTGITKSNKRPNCNAIHQYFRKKLNKISLSLEKNILSNKYTSKGDSLYFTKIVDDIVEIAEDCLICSWKCWRSRHYRC